MLDLEAALPFGAKLWINNEIMSNISSHEGTKITGILHG